MKKNKIIIGLHNINMVLSPMLFFLLIWIAGYKKRFDYALIPLVLLSSISFIDGALILKYLTILMDKYLKNLEKSDLTGEKKRKNKNLVFKWYKFFGVLKIIAALLVVYFYFLLKSS